MKGRPSEDEKYAIPPGAVWFMLVLGLGLLLYGFGRSENVVTIGILVLTAFVVVVVALTLRRLPKAFENLMLSQFKKVGHAKPLPEKRYPTGEVKEKTEEERLAEEPTYRKYWKDL